MKSTPEITAALLAEIPFGRWITRAEINGTPGADGLTPHSIGQRLNWLVRDGQIAVNTKSRHEAEYQRKAK